VECLLRSFFIPFVIYSILYVVYLRLENVVTFFARSSSALVCAAMIAGCTAEPQIEYQLSCIVPRTEAISYAYVAVITDEQGEVIGRVFQGRHLPEVEPENDDRTLPVIESRQIDNSLKFLVRIVGQPDQAIILDYDVDRDGQLGPGISCESL
jgi:hypothetical protein